MASLPPKRTPSFALGKASVPVIQADVVPRTLLPVAPTPNMATPAGHCRR
jgi:hypothetical protein